MLEPVTFADFSGGQADLYIGTDTNRQATLLNFLIDETKKPYVRDGTSIFAARIPGAFAPTGLYMGPEPFSHQVVIAGPSAYVANESASQWTEIKGNTSILPTKTTQRESALLWRRQLITVAPVTGVPASMAYATQFVTPSTPNTTATYKALTLGLPALANSPTIHYSASDAYIAQYAFFYKYTFIDYTGTLFAFFGNPNLPALVNGSAAADPSSSNISITNIPVITNGALTNYDTTAAVTTNTTYTANSTSATVASATGLVVGQQLINANVVPGTVITAINGTTITLSQPASSTAAASSTVYSALTVQIYRSINGGNVLFYNGMIANGVTSYTDAVSDATVQLNQAIYTSNGALGYDQPPTGAIAVAQTNDFFWYATSTTLYQSIQGAPGACPSSLSDQIGQKIIGLSDVVSYPILFCDKSVFRVEGTFDSYGNGGFVPREIHQTAGCISNNSIVKTPYGLVWFGNGGIYATDGYKVEKISNHLNISYKQWNSPNTVGEYDPTRNIVYWTITQFYNPSGFTNAWLVLHLNYGLKPESVFSVLSAENNFLPTAMRFSQAIDIYRADPLVTTTATFANASATIVVASASGISIGQSVTGVGIPYGTTVSAVNGTTITLSKNTTDPGTGVSVGFSRSIYSQFYGRMAFTDANQYLLWFDPNSLTDVLIDNNISPSLMAKKTIIYDLTTGGLDAGTPGFRKYTPDVALEVDAATPVAIQIKHRRDDGGGGWSGDGGTPPSTKGGIAGSPGGGSGGIPGVPEIRQDGAITWGITDCVWSTDANEHMWNDFQTVAGKRAVPATQLRSSRRQLKFTNAYTIIAGSDQYGTATVASPGAVGGYPTVTLDTVGQIWITDPEGYWITFSGDGYNQTFYIKARFSDTVLQITDPLSRLVVGSQKWEIKGYRKFERPRILNFTMYAEVEGPTFAPPTAPTGANA